MNSIKLIDQKSAPGDSQRWEVRLPSNMNINGSGIHWKLNIHRVCSMFGIYIFANVYQCSPEMDSDDEVSIVSL